MADTYSDLVNSKVGKQVASRLGLPRPVRLRRYAPDRPLVPGPVLVAGVGEAPLAARAVAMLRGEAIDIIPVVAEGQRVGAVVLDLSSAKDLSDLDAFRTILGPALKKLAPSGRVVVFGGSVASAGADPMLRATRRALEGVVRSIGKELRAGATANLVTVVEGEEVNADAALRFFLSGRSAYVDGQVVTVGAAFGGPALAPDDWHTPWPARSPSSPAPHEGSAPPSRRCSRATGRPSSASTSRRRGRAWPATRTGSAAPRSSSTSRHPMRAGGSSSTRGAGTVRST